MFTLKWICHQGTKKLELSMNETIVEINKLFKEFSKELHSPYECAELFCEIRKKYGFEFEINPFKDCQVVGSNFPYINGQEVEWIRFHYSIFKKDGLIEYKMYLE